VFVGIDLAEARRMNFNYVGKIIGPKVRGHSADYVCMRVLVVLMSFAAARFLHTREPM